MLNLQDDEIRFALRAVQQASALVRQVQSEMLAEPLAKEDRSPVTVGDLASQALVAKLLSDAFPGVPLVAEEDSGPLRMPAGSATLAKVVQFVDRFLPGAGPAEICDWIDAGKAEPGRRFWILDPLDGTKGYLRGDQYAVALALIQDGQVRVGALGCPNLSDGYRPDPEGDGSLLIAARGQGAWATSLANPDQYEHLHVSRRSDPAQARILRSYEGEHTNAGQIDQLAQALGSQAEPVRMDSQAKYAVLASGKADLILRLLSPAKPDYREKIWDQAAGSLLVEEAGGRITDLAGKPLDFSTGRMLNNNRGILASNGLLHSAALEALQVIGA